MAELGPFTVSADAISRLGVRFTPFINELLQRERASAGLAGKSLSVTAKENIPDGGVDAELNCTSVSSWIPLGLSAWQFKRAPVSVSDIKSELLKAYRAHDVLARGGAYVLAIGAEYPSRGIADRRMAILEAANDELGLGITEERVVVLDANSLSDWSRDFPTVSLLRIFPSSAAGAVTLEDRTSSIRHQTEWIDATGRRDMIARLQSELMVGSNRDLRVQGPSGIGKSRLVVEALRGTPLAPLVAYIDNSDEANAALFSHLLDRGQSVVLVVDECGSRRHEQLAARIHTDADMRLVTIGMPDGYPIRGPIFAPEEFSGSDIEQLLIQNFRSVTVEARRVIAELAHGNPSAAILLAERLSDRPPDEVVDLISRGSLQEVVATLVPGGGDDFFDSAVLALFERIGWDREKSYQVDRLIGFRGLELRDLHRMGDQLEGASLFSRQGRYRAVEPLPFALLLAAHAWRVFGEEIVEQLLPGLDEEMSGSLFRRLGQLGRYEPVRDSLESLLDPNSTFGTLSALEENGAKAFLSNFAIVSPDDAISHVERLFRGETRESLAGRIGLRRELVWTLEKLVWHTRTFERAADQLLLLAVAENETYSNNATGVWISLFSPALPATAADPDARLRYLSVVAGSDDAKHRSIVVNACRESLRPRGSVMVSGELQGGAIVEPRGGVRTYEEQSAFWNRLLGMLNVLRSDPDGAVAEAAMTALIKAIPMHAENQFVSDKLISIVRTFDSTAGRSLRRQLARYVAIIDEDGDSKFDERSIALRVLLNELPTATLIDHMEEIGSVDAWRFDRSNLALSAEEAVRGASEEEKEEILSWLTNTEVPSRWHIARVLGRVTVETDMNRYLRYLGGRPDLIAGLLQGRVDAGVEDAFEDFLSSPDGQQLQSGQRLALAVRGPATGKLRLLVLSLVGDLDPADAIPSLFSWRRQLSLNEISGLLVSWRSQALSQATYNSVIDWVSITLDDADLGSAKLESEIWSWIGLRREFPDMGRESIDWARITTKIIPQRSMLVVELLLDLIQGGLAVVHAPDELSELLGLCASVDPEGTWTRVADSLETDDWRVAMELREWFTPSISPQSMEAWVGDSEERARLLAGIAHVEENASDGFSELDEAGAGATSKLSSIAGFLLTTFPGNSGVASALSATFNSGGWVGPWSGRIRLQITKLEAWRAEWPAISHWVDSEIAALRRELRQSLEREAERGY